MLLPSCADGSFSEALAFGDITGDGLPEYAACPSVGCNNIVWYQNTATSSGGAISYDSGVTVASAPTVSNIGKMVIAGWCSGRHVSCLRPNFNFMCDGVPVGCRRPRVLRRNCDLK